MNINPLDIFSSGGRKSERPKYDGDVFTLEFGTERVTKAGRKGLTVTQAFSDYASELGFDPARAGVAFKLKGEVVSGGSEIAANQTYSAYTTHESKGRR